TKERVLEVYDQLARDTATSRAVAPLTAAQIDMLKAMLYVVAFLRTWNKRVRRDILEAGLVLMPDDRLREPSLSSQPLANRSPGRRRPALLDWLPLALEQLHGSGGIEQELHEDMPFIKIGPTPPDPSDFPSYLAKAAEAVRVIAQLGEQQVRQAVE